MKRTKPLQPEYLSVNECEIVSGLSRWTWRKWAYDGRVASVKVSSRLLIPATEVQRVMQANLRPAVEALSAEAR